MKFANIEVFINNCGTISIRNNDLFDYNIVSFPVELIPTLIDCLNVIYKENNGKSEIVEDDDE